MSKAQFRAIRERLGIRQCDLADALSVRLDTVKKWEKPNFSPPPEYAWQFINDMKERHDFVVNSAVDAAIEMRDQTGSNKIVLTYYRDQAQFDKHGRDEGSFFIANANTNHAAILLEENEFEVEFRYPDEGAISTPGSNY